MNNILKIAIPTSIDTSIKIPIIMKLNTKIMTHVFLFPLQSQNMSYHVK